MIGGTLQGKSRIEGLPFIHSVELMIPYWIWRAIGGTFMFVSHIIFAYNLYKMKPLPHLHKKAELVGGQV